MVEKDDRAGKEVSKTVTGVKDNLINTRVIIDTVSDNRLEDRYNINGNKYIGGSHNKSYPAGHHSKNILEGENTLDNGLFIVDLKRRRVDGLEQDGSQEDKNINDITMSDTQANETQNQKNLIKAGAARQTLLKL